MVHVRTFIMLLLMSPAMTLNNTKGKLRVIGGTDDVASKYPFVVCLNDGFYRRCTGTLITSTWVLSAAHCCNDIIRYIQWGNMKLRMNQTESKSEVLKMLPHPRYVPNTMACNDIGLLLVRQVIMKAYGKVSALDYKTMPGHQVEFAGFGMTYLPIRETRGKLITELYDQKRPLQIGKAVVTSCDGTDYISVFGCICVSPKCSEKQLAMQGDSGGPLFFEGKIVAVVQSGPDDVIDTDSFYTPVSPHLNWIHSVVTSDKRNKIK